MYLGVFYVFCIISGFFNNLMKFNVIICIYAHIWKYNLGKTETIEKWNLVLMIAEKCCCWIFVSSLFVIKRRPLKHHHNELYFYTPKLEVFRNVFQALSKEYFLKVFDQVVSKGFIFKKTRKLQQPFSRGGPKNENQ